MIKEISSFIKKVVPEGAEFSVQASENQAFGHYSTNVAMRLASAEKRPPIEIANRIIEQVKKGDRDGFFSKIEAAPPGFINFWISNNALQNIFLNIVKAGEKWGSEKKNGKTVVIDYSHPNIAKPMGAHHLRSTIIGAALYNTFAFLGWRAIGDNHLGDWGKQFGIIIAAWKELKEKPRQTTIETLMKLYVGYAARMKENPSLEEAARLEIKKLQEGDRENTKLWREFYKVSLREFQKVYAFLGVKFDYYLGESFYRKELSGIVELALQKRIAKRSEGAVVIETGNKTPFIIQKSDEAFLYSTTDLAAARYRVKKFKADYILYVVDNGQSLHFEQLFVAAKKLGFMTDEVFVHVKFGLLLGEDMKKLSTRGGKHIALQEVFEEAIQKAYAVVDKKRGDLSARERATIARAVGISALKYNDLSQNRLSDIAFNWDKMLNLEGNSAPYLMYTYARLKSILRKAKKKERFDVKALESDADFGLILGLLRFPEVLREITEDYFPNHLTDYLYSLSSQANAFYQSEPVLKAEPRLRAARLALVGAVAATLKTGFKLLGIQALERM